MQAQWGRLRALALCSSCCALFVLTEQQQEIRSHPPTHPPIPARPPSRPAALTLLRHPLGPASNRARLGRPVQRSEAKLAHTPSHEHARKQRATGPPDHAAGPQALTFERLQTARVASWAGGRAGGRAGKRRGTAARAGT